LKILHIIHNVERAGAQVNLFNLVTAPADCSIEHCVFAWKREGDMGEAFLSNGVDLHIGGGGHSAVWAALKALLDRFQPDIVHAHMSDSGYWAQRAGTYMNAPFLLTFQDGTRLVPQMAFWKRWVRMWVLKRAAQAAAYNSCVTQSLREMAAQTLGLPEYCDVPLPNAPQSAALYIPNTVAVPDLTHRAVSAPPRIFCLGRYVATKGQDQLINAVPIVLKHVPDAVFDIVGAGPTQQALTDQVSQLGLEKHVNITGPTNAPDTYFKSAAVYVSPSHYEGTSLALLEAMSWQMPIVVSDVPGNQDIIRHEATGLLYPLYDIDALASCIIRLLQDQQEANALAQAARADVVQNFGAQAILAQYVALYQAMRDAV